MTVTRIHEDPRVTRPYAEAQWAEIDALGRAVDRELARAGVRLTQGGEPTFVSIDDMDGAEWNYTALSPRKWELAEQLAWRLRERFAPGGLLFYGQGKWYPGEPLPRWALGLHWRRDGRPLWRNRRADRRRAQARADATAEHARALRRRALAHELGPRRGATSIPAYEDPLPLLAARSRPAGERRPGARAAEGLRRSRPAAPQSSSAVRTGLPATSCRCAPRRPAVAAKPAGSAVTPATWASEWQSSPWPLRRERLFLAPRRFAGRVTACRSARCRSACPRRSSRSSPRDPFDPRDDLHDAHASQPRRKRRATGRRRRGRAR